MTWLNSLKDPGHVTHAVVHLNHAADQRLDGASIVDVSRIYADALNKLQTEWVLLGQDPDIRGEDGRVSEVKAFQSMALKALPETSRSKLLASTELGGLVALTPRILNHDTLRRREHRPGAPMDDRLAKEASEEHRKLETALTTYASEPSQEVAERVVKRMAELLYVVRSNIAHGEKTPYGPDHQKAERDSRVCAVIAPLQALVLSLLLDQPDSKLLVYGTLAPGGANHSVLSSVSGRWVKCTTWGQLDNRNGLPLLQWAPGGPPVSAQLLVSPELKQNWERLDRFEGSAYRRHLVVAVTEDGVTVANCYSERGEHSGRTKS